MKGIKNKLGLIVPMELAALLTAAPAQSMQSSPICRMLPPIIFELAENYERKSQLLGTEFQFEYQMELSHEDAKCIDESLKKISKGKYKFTPRIDHQKRDYFKIEKSPQYLASNENYLF